MMREVTPASEQLRKANERTIRDGIAIVGSGHELPPEVHRLVWRIIGRHRQMRVPLGRVEATEHRRRP